MELPCSVDGIGGLLVALLKDQLLSKDLLCLMQPHTYTTQRIWQPTIQLHMPLQELNGNNAINQDVGGFVFFWHATGFTIICRVSHRLITDYFPTAACFIHYILQKILSQTRGRDPIWDLLIYKFVIIIILFILKINMKHCVEHEDTFCSLLRVTFIKARFKINVCKRQYLLLL